MTGDVTGSYVLGIAVTRSYARVVALHDVKGLLVKNNVGFFCRGHNIFLENGTEEENVIVGNLIISP